MAKDAFPLMDTLEQDMGGAKAAKAQEAKPAPKADDRVRIVLEENDDIPPTGLFIGLNGTGYLIRPGEEVLVPAAVLEILNNAVMSGAQVDPQTQQVVGWRHRMRYPYRRL